MPDQAAPPERMRAALTDARNAGLGWSTAWKLGRRAALLGVRTTDRRDWAVALNGTSEAWRAAYLGGPFPGPAWPLEPPTND